MVRGWQSESSLLEDEDEATKTTYSSELPATSCSRNTTNSTSFPLVIHMIKEILKKTPLINLFIRLKKCFAQPKPQNDEAVIIDRLIKRYVIPNTFIEFGFSGWE